MSEKSNQLISCVLPFYNEADNLLELHNQLTAVLSEINKPYEIVYCNDGSTDSSLDVINKIMQGDKAVKLVSLSRNFGKESALAAGIACATGAAIITLDSDGQHPADKIPEFIKEWENGAQVVVGVGKGGRRAGLFKLGSSKIFYKIYNYMSDQKLIPGSTDFRLIDREVQQSFLELKENDRITRGLIDWLGYSRAIINFNFNPRRNGKASYSPKKMINLATNSFVSLTAMPLYIFGYLGVFITATSFILGLAIIIEQLVLEDPLNWNFTGTAMLGILNAFLVGLVLLSIGILSIYISRMQNQSRQRPLYIIDKSRSKF